ncbi:NAD(P)H-hydrate dehydratase [Alginatibacterium sediminis]|uniref:Bifunctional NAD(P)H-hydrate repair enzyme n=1 Tax=Alginatibacterium sediminis TaxID=2164068 RepID=A0A420E7R2_9ALTE|nr:NAD(P)H-hydrate dehydratase [Alginatibacterium sediminis]RKF14521.1 NAD(P)H-hydrate dehydratase [Alginatibacterium sediminis]
MSLSTSQFSKRLPQSLWRAEQLRQQEEQLASALGITTAQLMERAGSASFEFLQEQWPRAQNILVLAGNGNNGGDAFVIARLAKQAGMQVQVVQVDSKHERQGPALLAEQAWLADGGELELAQWADWSVDLIVDGLLGTGLSGELRDAVKELIERVNRTEVPVFAIDAPSGLCCSTGRSLGATVKATATITFIALKQGLLTGQAPEFTGELVFAGLGVDQQFETNNKATVKRLTEHEFADYLKPRSKLSHKGEFGRVAVIGGDLGMPGAIRLAGEACLRSGAGLVNLLTRNEHQRSLLSHRPELMVDGVKADDPLLAKQLERASVNVIGPGLGQEAWGSQLFKQCLESEKPLLVDADGLNLLVNMPRWRSDWILTPHPGEASRLLGCSVADIEDDRITAARNIQKRFGGVCVLKGAGTVIAGEDNLVYVVKVGNPGMASGGMGDVLSGIIGALLAQSLPLFPAACLGVSIHGRAADEAAKEGERGMLASDLMPHIRKLVNP